MSSLFPRAVFLLLVLHLRMLLARGKCAGGAAQQKRQAEHHAYQFSHRGSPYPRRFSRRDEVIVSGPHECDVKLTLKWLQKLALAVHPRLVVPPAGYDSLISSMKLFASVLFAAALAPIDVTLTADLDGSDGIGKSFRKWFFAPGVQRAGGLGVAQLLTSR